MVIAMVTNICISFQGGVVGFVEGCLGTYCVSCKLFVLKID